MNLRIAMQNFNSIKVRLEHNRPYKFRDSESGFQFHKGTIRTPYFNDRILYNVFQFHKGTIRTFEGTIPPL